MSGMGPIKFLVWLWLMAGIANAAVPDVSLALNESAANETAQQLIGLEIKLANGAQLRLKSVALDLQPQQAAFQLGVEARAANTIGLPLNLTLKGFIRDGQRTDAKLSLPVTLTDVELANGLLTPLLKLMVGEWLSPARWSTAIPALELPATFAQTVSIPAATVDVAGEMPMTVTTQALQLSLNFALARVSFAENRLSVALQWTDDANAEIAEFPAADDAAPLAVRVSRSALARLLQAVANANAQDLSLRLKPARIRQEQIDTLVKVTNYTEVESGEGQADLKQVIVEQLHDGLLGARLLAQGNFTAKLRGREYGIPYRLSPHGQFGIQDRSLSLRLMSEAGKVWLQGLPGMLVPVNLRMNFPIAGRDIGFDRQLNLPAERVINRWELPALWAREFALPRKLAVQADKSLQIVESQPLTLALSQLQATTQNDTVLLTAAFFAKRKD